MPLWSLFHLEHVPVDLRAHVDEQPGAKVDRLESFGVRHMRIFESNRKERKRAQTLVEFALVLPLLLVLIYGILEVGRLIFIYSILVSASREAVRYGSATGLNVGGGVPRYNDCAGMRAAAQNVDFLNAFADADILITYDRGPVFHMFRRLIAL